MGLFSVPPTHGYFGESPKTISANVILVDGVPKRVIKIKVHEFSLNDIDDPISYIAGPLTKWESSEQGKYIISTAVESPMWNKYIDYETHNIHVCITAKLFEEDAVYYSLKWK